LELSLKKLKPEGLFIAETVNPHSAAALKAFWVDLTHQQPIFPEVALALCKTTGFGSAFVFHPNGTGDVEETASRPANTLWSRPGRHENGAEETQGNVGIGRTSEATCAG
jgi:hypothetical protein